MDEIGARLREARMRAKIDINEVEVRTKIRAKYLRAMENEEWDLLPGEVYIRSFLRTYGDFLGLDSRELVDDFRRRYENPSDHEPPPIAPPGRERRERGLRQRQRMAAPRRGVPPWVIIGLVLVVVAVVLYIVGTGNNSSQNDTTAGKGPSTAVTHHHTHHRKKKKPVKRKPPTPTSVSLGGVATGDVYVCLTNARGKVLIPGRTFSAGQTIPTEAGRTLLLTLGNASVALKANGRAIEVPASSAAIGLKFTPKGHASLPPAQQPSCT